jgi:hypothetical protein
MDDLNCPLLIGSIANFDLVDVMAVLSWSFVISSIFTSRTFKQGK